MVNNLMTQIMQIKCNDFLQCQRKKQNISFSYITYDFDHFQAE